MTIWMAPYDDFTSDFYFSFAAFCGKNLYFWSNFDLFATVYFSFVQTFLFSWIWFKFTCRVSRCFCSSPTFLPYSLEVGPIVALMKTHVNACGVKWPLRAISVAAELLQTSAGTCHSGKPRSASQLPNRSFSANERTHKAADKPGDKGLFNGVGGGLKVKDLLVSNTPNRAHMSCLSVAGVLDKAR